MTRYEEEKMIVREPAPVDRLEKISVLGVPVHLADSYSAWLLSRAQHQQGGHVVTLNAEMTMQAEQDRHLARIIHQADLVIPDGSGIVFYLKLYGKHIERRPGIELAERLLEAFGESPALGSVFFFGGAPGVAEQAADSWRLRSPQLPIAGVQHGYLTPDDEPRFAQTLKELQPAIVLVGLGVPRQEYWIAEHRHLCPQAIWIGVGGSFDIWAGTKVRAPEFFRKNHLEWLYRLYQEPWRWRRMLALPQFALKSILYRMKKAL
jgi:N-acetylglucosaminyldiphosphoundecaprenol N-acetyl-beta-D-mannosaminyltransferase